MAKKRRYAQITHKIGQFSGWIIFSHIGKKRVHKVACCDCGLIHAHQFRAAKVIRRKGKVVRYALLSRAEVVVMHRVQRDERSTAAHRRKKSLTRIKKALRHGA